MAKKHTTGVRLYKKLEKRYRSEDKARHYRQRQDVRAKVILTRYLIYLTVYLQTDPA